MASYNQFNYNYRPAKSIERKLFVELLKEIYGVINLASTTYIGLGSIFFADFRLLHKELGISKMINIEYNRLDEERFKYNKPFSCIELLWGMTTEVLPGIDWSGNKIIWLDYDQALQTYMLEDIEAVFTNLEPNSFYFVTCNSSMNRFYDNASNAHSEPKFKAEFGDYTPFYLKPEMLTNKKSPYLIRKMVNDQIKYILDQRNAAIENTEDQLVYCQLLFIIYQDGAPMISTGGILKRQGDLKKFIRSRVLNLPYIRTGENYLDLETPILTNSEIDLINTCLPKLKTKFLKLQELEFIPHAEKEKYFGIYRFYPSFVEIRE